MLSLRKTMLMLMVCLCTYTVSTAQQAEVKPKLFASYPSSFTISETCLQNVFTMAIGQVATIDFGNNLLFPCQVLRNDVKYSSMQTVIIRSTAFDNALFQITKITNRDQSFSYSGRIINERASDGFEIKKTTAGTYQLQKFETDRILEGCFL
ncbi:MAG: hypothetical protein EOO13_10835 [Chitinophagaceae bacterium]|nr:MAG: hypothetical protein EOO13_10835 [Chitinophagaceae bacterium]